MRSVSELTATSTGFGTEIVASTCAGDVAPPQPTANTTSRSRRVPRAAKLFLISEPSRSKPDCTLARLITDFQPECDTFQSVTTEVSPFYVPGQMRFPRIVRDNSRSCVGHQIKTPIECIGG